MQIPVVLHEHGNRCAGRHSLETSQGDAGDGAQLLATHLYRIAIVIEHAGNAPERIGGLCGRVSRQGHAVQFAANDATVPVLPDSQERQQGG